MSKISSILALMRSNPKGIRFNDLQKVCDHYFGEPRQQGSSHRLRKIAQTVVFRAFQISDCLEYVSVLFLKMVCNIKRAGLPDALAR